MPNAPSATFWRNIGDEKWNVNEVEKTRRGLSSLLCGVCRKAGITKNMTREKFECAGCIQRTGSKAELGQEHFGADAVKNHGNKGDLLVCTVCKERDTGILNKIKTLDGSGICPCS